MKKISILLAAAAALSVGPALATSAPAVARREEMIGYVPPPSGGRGKSHSRTPRDYKDFRSAERRRRLANKKRRRALRGK